jgi:hypothetical protein
MPIAVIGGRAPHCPAHISATIAVITIAIAMIQRIKQSQSQRLRSFARCRRRRFGRRGCCSPRCPTSGGDGLGRCGRLFGCGPLTELHHLLVNQLHTTRSAGSCQSPPSRAWMVSRAYLPLLLFVEFADGSGGHRYGFAGRRRLRCSLRGSGPCQRGLFPSFGFAHLLPHRIVSRLLPCVIEVHQLVDRLLRQLHDAIAQAAKGTGRTTISSPRARSRTGRASSLLTSF